MDLKIFANSTQTTSIDKTIEASLDQKAYAINNEEIFAPKVTTCEELSMDELMEFNKLFSEKSGGELRNISGGQSARDIPYPLKKDKYFGDIWNTSPTTFKVVFGTGEGDKPYTDTYEFDSQPTCVENKDGSLTYSGTIDGKKIEFITKNNKIVSIKQYSDDGKVIGTIDYDSSTGEKKIKEYYEDGKTLKATYKRGLDGIRYESEFYKNGNISRTLEETPDGDWLEANYYENGQLNNKHININGRQTLYIDYSSSGRLGSIALDGGNVNLDTKDYTKSTGPEGDIYTSPDGNTIVIINKDGTYTITQNGETKRYNEKGEPIKE